MKLDFYNARGPDPGVEDVLGGGDVGVLPQPVNILQEVLGTIRQVIFISSQECSLYATVFP